MTTAQRWALELIVCAAAGETPGREAGELLDATQDSPLLESRIATLARAVVKDPIYAAKLSDSERRTLQGFVGLG
jgi:hypothetical protein